jgi:hypothetical protein
MLRKEWFVSIARTGEARQAGRTVTAKLSSRVVHVGFNEWTHAFKVLHA